MKEIWELSKEYGFKIIEDASHALGGEYLEKKIGNCEYSDMAVFSFHPVKMITTGEGGAIMTNDKILSDKISLLRSHGVTKNNFQKKSDGDWYYEQQTLGFNYRLTDIQAALGISQLKRIDYFVKKRQKIATRYYKELKNIELPYQHPDSKSSWHLFVVKVKNRKKVFNELRRCGVTSQVHYIPVNKQPYYGNTFLKNSDSYYNDCLSLPIYVDLTSEEQDKVINSLVEIK